MPTIKRNVSATADIVLGSPLRNLVVALVFVVAVFVVATLGYVAAGWTLGDAVSW